MKLHELIKGTSYCVPLRAATPSAFWDLVLSRVPNDSLSIQDAIAVLAEEASTLEIEVNRAGRLGQLEAYKRLVADDLSVLVAFIQDNARILAEPIENRLVTAFATIQGSLRALGLSSDYFEFKIVDEFPGAYAGKPFWAMNFDATNLEQEGISIGTQLKREHLLPLYSESLLAHELIHACFGHVAGRKLARGLEEGIADLLGHLYISSRLIGRNASQALIVNSRLWDPQQGVWRNYSEALRQAAVLHQRLGLSGLVALVRECQMHGRNRLEPVEERLLSAGRVDGMRDPRTHARLPDWATSEEEHANDFMNRFIAFPQSLVVSPLALHMAESIEIGLDFTAMIERDKLAPGAATAALKDLTDTCYLVVAEGGRITYDETKVYIRVGCLRYSRPAVE